MRDDLGAMSEALGTRATPSGHGLILLAAVLLAAVAARPADGGAITGRYYFLGISNGQSPEENDGVWDALRQYAPWKDAPAAQHTLDDNAGKDRITAHLKAFKGKVAAGDTFVFYYSGHSGKVADADGDEPEAENKRDEVIGLTDNYITDDVLASDELFGCFPACATVIVIMNTCYAGGMADGVNDLGRQAIRDKHNLLFIGSAGADEICDGRRAAVFPNDLARALESADTNPADKQTHVRELAGRLNALWQERGYTLAISDNLDNAHDSTFTVVPLPSSAVLGAAGLLGVLSVHRLHKRFRING